MTFPVGQTNLSYIHGAIQVQELPKGAVQLEFEPDDCPICKMSDQERELFILIDVREGIRKDVKIPSKTS